MYEQARERADHVWMLMDTSWVTRLCAVRLVPAPGGSRPGGSVWSLVEVCRAFLVHALLEVEGHVCGPRQSLLACDVTRPAAGLLVRFLIKSVKTYQPQPEMVVEAPEFMTVEYLKRRIMKAKLLRGEVGRWLVFRSDDLSQAQCSSSVCPGWVPSMLFLTPPRKSADHDSKKEGRQRIGGNFPCHKLLNACCLKWGT